MLDYKARFQLPDCASVWPDGTDAYFCATPDQFQALLDHVAAGTVPDVDAWHEAM